MPPTRETARLVAAASLLGVATAAVVGSCHPSAPLRAPAPAKASAPAPAKASAPAPAGEAPVSLDAAPGARLLASISRARATSATPSDDGTALVATRSDGAAVVLDTRRLAQRAVLEQTGKLQPKGPPERESYQFVLGGKSLLGIAERPTSRGYEIESVLRIWSATTGHLGGERHFISAGLGLSWSPDGRFVAVVQQVYLFPSRGVSLFRVEDLALLGFVDGGSHTSDRIVWSPDGSAIAVLGEESPNDGSHHDGPTTIQVWDVRTQALRTTIDPSQLGTAEAVEWTPDGASLVVSPAATAPESGLGLLEPYPVRAHGGEDQVSLWNARTGALLEHGAADAGATSTWRTATSPPHPAFTIEQGSMSTDLQITRAADGARITLHSLVIGAGIELIATTGDGLFDGNPALVRFRLGEDLGRSTPVPASEIAGRRRAGLVGDFLDGKEITRRGD